MRRIELSSLITPLRITYQPIAYVINIVVIMSKGI